MPRIAYSTSWGRLLLPAFLWPAKRPEAAPDALWRVRERLVALGALSQQEDHYLYEAALACREGRVLGMRDFVYPESENPLQTPSPEGIVPVQREGHSGGSPHEPSDGSQEGGV